MTNHKSALVLIDLQKESNFGLDDMNDVLENAKKIIPAFREADIPIIYTRQINREDTVGLSKGEPLNEDGTPYFYNAASDQIEIFNEIKPADEDVVIDKYRWSAFFDTSLDLMLKSLDVEHLYIGGVVTDGCLMTSVFDAYFRDYQINLIHDLCTASNEGAHQAAMLTMTNWVYNLNIFSTDELIKKLNGEEYNFFKANQVDQMQFTADTMEAKFKEITNP